MIGQCWFERITGIAANGEDTLATTIHPQMDYGLYMAEYDAPPPEPKIYRVQIEGRNGSLDFSEWEGSGQIRYNDRTVTVKFIDMNGQQNANKFVRQMLGNRFHVHFDDDAEYYFVGRCENAHTETRRHVTTIELTFTCHPFRYALNSSSIWLHPSAGKLEFDSAIIDGMNVIPSIEVRGIEQSAQNPSKITLTRVSTGTFVEFNVSENGYIDLGSALLWAGENELAVRNNNQNNSIEVTMTWRPEVL